MHCSAWFMLQTSLFNIRVLFFLEAISSEKNWLHASAAFQWIKELSMAILREGAVFLTPANNHFNHCWSTISYGTSSFVLSFSTQCQSLKMVFFAESIQLWLGQQCLGEDSLRVPPTVVRVVHWAAPGWAIHSHHHFLLGWLSWQIGKCLEEW